MSLFSYLDTRAPSTEEIIKVETEYNDDGSVKEATWLDTYELSTEMSLQRLCGFFGTLSVIVAIIGVALSLYFSIRTADGTYSAYSAVILIIGLVSTAAAFGLVRLARAFVNFMLVRLLQEEE